MSIFSNPTKISEKLDIFALLQSTITASKLAGAVTISKIPIGFIVMGYTRSNEELSNL
jgi:hypothetical protein